MKRHTYFLIAVAATVSLAALLASSCNSGQANQAAEAPPAAQVIPEQNGGAFSVEHPEQYPLATAGQYVASPQLDVTGTVSPDISRNVPVISLASGRVLDIHARLGDTVTKGQLLMRVQSQDIAQAFSDYQQATADETLAASQLTRAKDLYAHGAIALNDLQVAEDAEAKAKVTVATAQSHLHILGADAHNPSVIVEVRAPVSGVITDQQVTNAAGVQGLGGPNPFTISDLSHVWVMCDVYENNLSFVRLGELADIHLTAYPDLMLKGRVGNIGPVLDPNLRTAKVRLEVTNPGMLRLGMFATATFYAEKQLRFATVPSTAILHLHDRNWVYEPLGHGRFQREEVVTGKMLPGANQPNQLQQITSGVSPGQQVVANALDMQSTVEQ